MRECFWAHPACRHLLQTVIAYGSCGVHGAFRVALFQKFALIRGVRPNSGQTVCLQLHFDRQCVPFIGFATHQRAYLLLNSDQFLHMMPQFMCKHVSLGKVSGRAKASLELVIKAKIDVNLFIGWAVERAGGGTSRSAARSSCVAKQHQLGVAIRNALLLKNSRPRLLGVIQDKRYKLYRWLFLGVTGAVGLMDD